MNLDIFVWNPVCVGILPEGCCAHLGKPGWAYFLNGILVFYEKKESEVYRCV
jgi:hypothetical protein